MRRLVLVSLVVRGFGLRASGFISSSEVELKTHASCLCFALADLSQVFKGINARCMPIGPGWLDPISPYLRQPTQPESLVIERWFGPFVEMAHNVGLPFATCAGTSAPQFFQWDKSLAAIIPLDRQLVCDRLNVQGPHSLNWAAGSRTFLSAATRNGLASVDTASKQVH